jgi:hypothetical protein
MGTASNEWITVEVRLPRQTAEVLSQLAVTSGMTRPAYIHWMIRMLLHHRTYLALFGALTRPEEKSG